MTFCPRCGNQLSPDALTCPRCGAEVAGTRSSEETVPAGDAGEAAAGPTLPPSEAGAFLPPGSPYPPGPAAPPFPPPTGFPPSALAEKRTSGMAVASLVLSIAGFLCLPVIGPIIGIILGIVARGQIKRESGRLEGNGLATAGIIVGIVAIVLTLAVAVPVGIGIYNYVKGPFDATNRFMQHIHDGQYDAAHGMLHPDSPLRSYSQSEFRSKLTKDFKGLDEWSANSFETRTSGGETVNIVKVDINPKGAASYSAKFSLRKFEGEWYVYDYMID